MGNCYYQYSNGRKIRVGDLSSMTASFASSGGGPYIPSSRGFGFDLSSPFKFNSVSPEFPGQEEKLEF